MNKHTSTENPEVCCLLSGLKQKFGKRLKTVVLFGSRARGDFRESSDYDIFLVVEDLALEPLQRLRDVRHVLLKCPIHANFVAKTPGELEASLSPLVLDVCIDGECLFGETWFEPYRQKAIRATQEAGLVRRRLGKEHYWEFKTQPTGDWELSWEGYHEIPV